MVSATSPILQSDRQSVTDKRSLHKTNLADEEVARKGLLTFISQSEKKAT